MHKKTVIDFKKFGKRLTFDNPLDELYALSIADVRPLLEKVEAYQKRGFFVVGYVTYEAAKAFEESFQVKSQPLMGEYLAYFTVHKTVKESDFPLAYTDASALDNNWQSLVSEEAYEQAIAKIHHHIRQGDTYQVNYTIQLQSELLDDSFAIYNRLVVEQDASYNAYIEHDDTTVISVSPELFFEKEKSILRTRPMKGTIKRGNWIGDDLKKRDWLAKDSKNRSENMMIVDLLRNDMSRISQIGSVEVKKLCAIEQYSTVWQMTSTIESRLKEKTTLLQIFEALFPCGSITGAPKISTMSIIDQLEPNPRGVYCGTIGLALPNGDSIFNVAIRTLQVQRSKAIYGVGGGITWESQWQDEFEETQQKSAVLHRKNTPFDVITTGLVKNQDLIFLEQHLKRMSETSRYFNYPFNQTTCMDSLNNLLLTLDSKKDYRLKITLLKNGDIAFEASEYQPLSPSFLRAVIVERKEALRGPFPYFKTSYRPHIPQVSYEQLFISSEGYLQETSIGNLVLEIDGKLYSPPVTVGILDGIYRNYLIKSGQVSERLLTKEDLDKANHIYACNSVRGLYEIIIN